MQSINGSHFVTRILFPSLSLSRKWIQDTEYSVNPLIFANPFIVQICTIIESKQRCAIGEGISNIGFYQFLHVLNEKNYKLLCIDELCQLSQQSVSIATHAVCLAGYENTFVYASVTFFWYCTAAVRSEPKSRHRDHNTACGVAAVQIKVD